MPEITSLTTLEEDVSQATLASFVGDRTIGHEPVTAPSVQLPKGARVNGRYLIEAFVSEGGMGAVYRARDQLRDDRCVALKTLLGKRMHETRIGLFMTEFRTMATLRHPNVAEVYDFEAIERSTDYLYSMEFISGSEILEATEGAGLPAILDDVVQICRALAYLHSRKVIHFDLKPANVLVTNGVVKVLDFGLAGARPTVESGHVVGTPHYMAPELAARDRVADHRVDLYSLGIMLFQLVCRRLPFSAESWIDLLAAHQVERVAFTAEESARIPEWLREVILKLCAKDPADRFRSANAVIEAINRGGGFDYELDTRETKESYVFSSRFVGREEPFERLLGFVTKRCDEGRAATKPLLLIGGQSGVGKSRLMRELRYHLQLSRQSFLEADCYEGSASDYAPVSQLLRAVARLLDMAGGGELIHRFGPQLVKIAPDLGVNEVITPAAILDNPESERRVVLDAVARFFTEAASRIPYVLYVNDLQWASASTVEILRLLAERVLQLETNGKRLPLALLGAFRDDEVKGRPLEGLIASQAAEPSLSLRPIGREQVARMIESMLGSEAPATFVERVASETGGNPFFIEEVVRALIENGSVFIRDDAWAATTEIQKLEIPASIGAVFRRRAAQLDASERALLELIALFARPLPVSILGRIMGGSPEQLYATLAALEQRQMIQRDSSDELAYRTTHDRVRQTVSADLGERSAAVHARLAQGLEATVGAEPGDWLYDLAHHYWHAGPSEAAKACVYNTKAGAAAASAYASAKAAELYERAISLLSPDQIDERRELQEKLADLLCLIGEHTRCIDMYQGLLDEGGDTLYRARLTRKIGEALFQKRESHTAFGKFVEVIEILGGTKPTESGEELYAAIGRERAEQEKRRSGEQPAPVTDLAEKRRLTELGETYNKMSYIFYLSGAYEASFLSEARAVNTLECVGDCPALALAYGSYGWLFGAMNQFDVARIYFELAWDVATSLDSALLRGILAAQRGGIAYFEARFADSLADADFSWEALSKTGDIWHLLYGHSSRYLIELACGRTRDALTSTASSIDVAERTGTLGFGALAAAVAALARARMGNFDRCDADIQSAIARLLAGQDRMFASMAQAIRGEVYLLAGRDDDAETAFEEAKQTRDVMKMTNDFNAMLFAPLARLSLKKLAAGATTRERAEALVNEAVEVGQKFVKHLPAALVVQGLWAQENGDPEAAERCFSEAIAKADALELKLAGSEAHETAGECALRRGDAALARRHLDAAIERYVACDCVVAAARCRALRERCDATK